MDMVRVGAKQYGNRVLWELVGVVKVSAGAVDVPEDQWWPEGAVRTLEFLLEEVGVIKVLRQELNK